MAKGRKKISPSEQARREQASRRDRGTAGGAEEEEMLGPLDVFDARTLGFPPIPLRTLIGGVAVAYDALGALADAMPGCMTPLNLSRIHKEVESCLAVLDDIGAQLVEAEEMISGDVSIALEFESDRSDLGPWASRREQETRVAPGEVLSPKQLLVLARRARIGAVPEELTTTYRDHLAGQRVTPQLARRLAGRHGRALNPAAENGAASLDDIESRACPQCHVGPGEHCVSVLGVLVGVPHAGRVKLAMYEDTEGSNHRQHLPLDRTQSPGRADAVAEILEDVQSRMCPRCGAGSSELCLTNSRRIAGAPHAARISLSSLAHENRDLVPLLSQATTAAAPL